MPDITITIPDDKVALILLAMPNRETKPDPQIVGKQVPRYTTGQWMKQIVIRYFKMQAGYGHDIEHAATKAALDTSDIL
ncbi:MAG TPA: hypothetical protein ENH62_08820 [Marinobacter sp.]|uniref:Uncharacterized protein n=1 Tax=marine sediment metagenome TaxID=412755 RepID=A0A0F9JX86_9ZZZZ|nr:hypothetical protein [Marinobacter sp.]